MRVKVTYVVNGEAEDDVFPNAESTGFAQQVPFFNVVSGGVLHRYNLRDVVKTEEEQSRIAHVAGTPKMVIPS